MLFTNARDYSAAARIGVAIVLGLGVMLCIALLLRPDMAMHLMHEAMGGS